MVVTTEVNVKDVMNKEKIVNEELLITALKNDVYRSANLTPADRDGLVTIGVRDTAMYLVKEGWRKPIIQTPNCVKMLNDVYIICKCCNGRIRQYSLDPFFPDCKEIENAVEVNSDTIYPNFCEHCGAMLK